MESSAAMTLCQSCLDRGLEPREAIGLYNKLPICDPCLGAIMDNKSDAPDNSRSEATSLASRKQRALEMLEQFEELAANWPLTAEETLLTHSDFYNHRPPALVNCTLEEIKEIYSRRKGLLYAIRHKDERWYTEIEQAKREAREKANLTGMLKSKEQKVRAPSAINLAQREKLAKSMGITLAELEAMGKASREREFVAIVGSPIEPVRVPEGTRGGSGAKKELDDLKAQVMKVSDSKVKKKNPFTGKWE